MLPASALHLRSSAKAAAPPTKPVTNVVQLKLWWSHNCGENSLFSRHQGSTRAKSVDHTAKPPSDLLKPACEVVFMLQHSMLDAKMMPMQTATLRSNFVEKRGTSRQLAEQTSAFSTCTVMHL